ncbi:hypothetical protein IZY60_15140 [Lutibacter sp. B2]|nr:hypothetical protein [Lutibacter sp. B2]
MNTLKEFIISIIASIIASVIFSVIMMNLSLSSTINVYPGLLSVVQTIALILIYFFCSYGYTLSVQFVDKHASDQSEVAEELRHKVYKYVWLMMYIGIILVAFGVFNKELTGNKGIFLNYGIELGVLTHEVKVFFLWVYEYMLAITFGRILWVGMRKDKSTLTLLKESKKSDVLIYFTGVAVLFLIVLI